MDIVTYLTTPTGAFGALEWVFFAIQAVAALAGIYLAFLQQDTHPVRGAALRRLGLALLVLGGVGVLFLALRLANVDPFTMPVWLYAVGLLEVVLAAYALFYRFARYPAAMIAYERSRQRGEGRRVVRPQPMLQTNGNGAGFSPPPRPQAAPGRREARRDRKRRGR